MKSIEELQNLYHYKELLFPDPLINHLNQFVITSLIDDGDEYVVGLLGEDNQWFTIKISTLSNLNALFDNVEILMDHSEMFNNLANKLVNR